MVSREALERIMGQATDSLDALFAAVCKLANIGSPIEQSGEAPDKRQEAIDRTRQSWQRRYHTRNTGCYHQYRPPFHRARDTL